jgi:hypothetical protein
MSQNTTSSRNELLRFASALTMAVLVPLTMATGCPFSAEEFQRHCAKASDCADDNPCTEDKCEGGVCQNPPKAKETACGAGSASVCDGKGQCVECVTSADCAANHPMKPICDLDDNKCVSCNDGVKNGKETDVDCGGPDCGACLGKPCDAKHGCGNHTFCAVPENICCSSACDGKCEACAEAKTGEPNGTCAPIPYGMDPDNECTALGSCGAAPGKCRCEDGVKNADESDVDCGGATCARCEGGKTCGGNMDCATDVPECTTQKICCTSTCDGLCFACDSMGQCGAQHVGFADPNCPVGTACGPLGTTTPCIGKAGTACSSGSKCLSTVCTANQCAKSQLGKPCSDDMDCAAGTCQNFICTL